MNRINRIEPSLTARDLPGEMLENPGLALFE
jgi:hypothetical protein